MANPCLSPLLPPSPSSRDSSPARLTAGFSLSGDDTNTCSSLVLQRPDSEDVTITFTLSTTTPPPTPPPHTIFPHLTSSSSSISNHVQPPTTPSASTNNVMTLPFLRRTASTHSQHHPRSDIDNDNSPSPSPVSPNLSEYASSNNPSPASHTLSMNSNDGHETHTSSSSDAQSSRMVSGTGQQQQGQQQQQQQQQVQSSAGRGGCWTCRIRRKKCDEQRTNDKCQTCIRLDIDCLGWGPRRPAWMRDKQAVERHKAAIKDKLSKAGMIRGVPRQPTAGAASGGSSSAAGPSRRTSGLTAASPYPHRPHPGPYFNPTQHQPPQRSFYGQVQHLTTAPAPVGSISGQHTDIDYFGGAQSSLAMPDVQDPYTRSVGMHGGTHSPHSPFATMNSYSLSSSQTSHSQHPQQGLQLQGSSLYTIPTPPPVPSHQPMLDESLYSSTANTPVSTSSMTANPNDPLLQKSFVEPHIVYYFNSVLPTQYPMASESLSSVMRNIISNESVHYGAVTHASCALASLHNKSLRVAHQYDQPDLDPQYSTASQFYNRACQYLFNDRGTSTAYSEIDAVAALQLISYALLSGGAGPWTAFLDIARNWLAATGIETRDNPRLGFLEFSEVGKFAARITMWFDIFSSVTTVQAPRFLGLYQRLLSSGGNGFWSRGEHNVQMESLMGCPDDVLLAFAEIAELAAWKAREQSAGTLSVRTLVRKGEAIEARLHSISGTEHAANVSGLLEPISAGLVVASNVSRRASPAQRQGSNSNSSSSSAASPPTIAVHMPLTASPEASLTSLPTSSNNSAISNIFRETAALYLQTVINDASPGVPEIANCAAALMSALQAFPLSPTDRALTLPLCLAGCMSNEPSHRDYISKRLAAQENAVWSAKTIANVIDQVWNSRAMSNSVVDWRAVIRSYVINEQIGPELLLV